MKKENKITEGLDILVSAKKLFIIGLISLGLMIVSIIGVILYEKSKTDILVDKLNHQSVVLVTNEGLVKGKTVTSFKEIAKQFSIITFLSTLNYDTTNPLPQINFMRIYANGDIFENYRKMLLGNTTQRYLTKDIYFTQLNRNNEIIIRTLKPNKKYQVVIQGIQQRIDKLNSKRYPITLTITIEKNENTGIENLFGMTITQYLLHKGN